jgi:cyclohexanecarboxylate-CoA ligase
MSSDDAELISERLFEIARDEPRRELVVDSAGGRYTYDQIAQQVRRLACGLRAKGWGPGDIIVLQLPNCIPFIIFHVALTAIGAITVNVPIVYRERELRRIFELTKARGLVLPRRFGSEDFGGLAAAMSRDSAKQCTVFMVGPAELEDPPGAVDYDRFIDIPWEKENSIELSKLRPTGNETTVLSFTSGTTGDLKGVMLSTQTLWSWNKGLIDRYSLTHEDRIFACSPLGHAVGFAHCLRMTFTLGATMVLLDRWDAHRALDFISRERCTFTAGATPFLMDLVYHPNLEAFHRLPTLRLFLCGGATIPKRLLEEARRALPHTFVSPLWGMTECGGVTTCPYDAPPEKPFTTDGLPCAGMKLKVVDASGRTVTPGIDGELLVGGPMLFAGYFRQPELTARAFLPDGFFRTGDRARMDEHGYIKITGRLKDLIIRGGVNISPAEIEDVLFTHPKVANVAVIGVPDHRLGERICACIVPAENQTLTTAEIHEWVMQAGLAKTKWPEIVEIIPSLPMTPSGKVQKFRLRETLVKNAADRSADSGVDGALNEPGPFSLQHSGATVNSDDPSNRSP